MFYRLLNSHSYLGSYLDTFHDHICCVLIVLCFFIIFLIVFIYWGFTRSKEYVDHKYLEVAWTAIPGCILLFLVVPSLYGLYMLEYTKISDVYKTYTIGGHQWYWRFTYPFSYSVFSSFFSVFPVSCKRQGATSVATVSLSYDSYLDTRERLYNFRNLTAQLPVVMVCQTLKRVLLFSEDVIHSFTIPDLGFKLDCVPGRLNQGFMSSHFFGVFFGQCSEICGVDHSFMPITLEVVRGIS